NLSFSIKCILEEDDTLESMHFGVAHRIVTGLALLDLEHQMDLNPNLVHETDTFGRTALFWAASRDDALSSYRLLERGAESSVTDFHGYTPLHLASAWGSYQCAKTLIEASANINAQDKAGDTPLLLTSMNGHLDVVNLL